ncbi:MAG: Fur family transcriptional regulator [Candidatus Uhrbacteria bacterium]|nr:transcriptional repressor [Patescibacteria group bacterium]MBU1907010.1 transcriptional repressor [Patescibacteria group bacterium]
MFSKIIKDSDYKLTRPRKLILELLEKRHRPLSAQEIHKRLKGSVDLVSVYRTLKIFEELGFLHREENVETIRYYLSAKPHHHIMCESCGRTECVPCRHNFSKIKGFDSIKHRLTLTGTCSACVK